MRKFHLITEKTQQKHQVENFVKKYCSFIYPHNENIKRKQREKMQFKSNFCVINAAVL